MTIFSNSISRNIFHTPCIILDISTFQHYTSRVTFHTSFSTCPHSVPSHPTLHISSSTFRIRCFSHFTSYIPYVLFHISHPTSTLRNSFPTSQISCTIITFLTVLHILYTTFHVSQFVFYVPIHAIQFVQQNKLATSKIFHKKHYLHQKNVNKHWKPKQTIKKM